MTAKPSRTVTRCVACGQKFKPKRTDARYCSGACRQAAHRAREKNADYDVAIEQARVAYWELVAESAVARGLSTSQVVTEQAQLVDVDGKVYVGALGQEMRLVGKTKPHRPGWAAWGLETAGPPYSPPPPQRPAPIREQRK